MRNHLRSPLSRARIPYISSSPTSVLSTHREVITPPPIKERSIVMSVSVCVRVRVCVRVCVCVHSPGLGCRRRVGIPVAGNGRTGPRSLSQSD